MGFGIPTTCGYVICVHLVGRFYVLTLVFRGVDLWMDVYFPELGRVNYPVDVYGRCG